MTVTSSIGKLNNENYDVLKVHLSSLGIEPYSEFSGNRYLGTILDSTWITKPKEHVVRFSEHLNTS